MKIEIRYDNHTTTVDVPEEDFTVMVQLDYEQRRATANDPASVQPRTPQEIMDERFNQPEYNSWRKSQRHTDANPVPARLDGRAGYLVRPPEGESSLYQYTVEDFPDTAGAYDRERNERDEEFLRLIRKKLKPEYAHVLIAVRLDGWSVADYAERTGLTHDAVYQRLNRAEKKFVKIFKKCQIWPLPKATEGSNEKKPLSRGGENSATQPANPCDAPA